MPYSEYRAWERHFRRWPPLEAVAPRLLATLAALVSNAGFKVDRPLRPDDYAPWLTSESARRRARQAAAAARVGEAYRRSGGNGKSGRHG